MTPLQEALERSIEKTSEQTRAFFQDPWTAEQVIEFVDAQRNVTIATSGPSGWAHAAVVIATCSDGELRFTVTPGSVLARNLAANDRIGFSVCDRSHAVLGQGRARRLGGALDIGATFTPQGWDGDVYAIDVSRIFAN